ncbi:MAG: acyl-protein synthetase [Clostridiales bacterium]|nr:acyl-protein synthetase [Clostridiales bacterium]
MEMRQHPFRDDQLRKDIVMTRQMLDLTEYHREHCAAYQRMLTAMGYDASKITHYGGIPFLPVTLFKKLRLSSLDEGQEDYKVITSSGTGGQARSQIVLDGETRIRQQQALASIGGDFVGTERMPMLIIDCPATVKKRNHYSARTAGILGFSLFGTHRTYALRDENMSLDIEAVSSFLERFGGQKFLVFGFTYIVWKYLLQVLEEKELHFDMSQAVLVHGGGWKRLENEAVSRAEYKRRIAGTCGIAHVMDYYGMAEQSGSIFMECPCGNLHCSDFSAVLIRRPQDFSLCRTGETGLIQVMSVLPKSYPGHSLLTEDEGRILGVDDCPCGRKGAYFEVLGRARHAELRGCSEMTG